MMIVLMMKMTIWGLRSKIEIVIDFRNVIGTVVLCHGKEGKWDKPPSNSMFGWRCQSDDSGKYCQRYSNIVVGQMHATSHHQRTLHHTRGKYEQVHVCQNEKWEWEFNGNLGWDLQDSGNPTQLDNNGVILPSS